MPRFFRSTANQPQSFPLPLDRLAIALMVALSLAIGMLLWGGERVSARVRDFSWQGRQIGADDTAFILSFSRPMNHTSVEQNLRITPDLPGKKSWAGRRMAYTLDMPAPYGTTFQVTLEGATDRFTQGKHAAMQPFKGQFRTRDRAFAYIGVDGEEAGRLMLFNLNSREKIPLTPPDLTVMEFKPYPLGDRILLTATQRNSQAQGLLEQKLYSVTTGIHVQPPDQLKTPVIESAQSTSKAAPAGQLELVLDNTDYQNLKFDLSDDGKVIVVQRVKRDDPAVFGPWIVRQGEPPQPLKGEPGGDFLITPDSSSLAIAQGQGLAILPLQPDAKPLDFLPKFGVVLAFSQDGSQAAMVKFNSDRTRSLFLVTNQGVQKELLRQTGSILSAYFDPTRRFLYCLLTDLNIQGDLYQEDPYLAVIDLKTGKKFPLVSLPGQRDVQFSLAPDGFAVLFDQATHATTADPGQGGIRDSSGKAIANSRLWLLPLNPIAPATNPQPEALPLAGLKPRWLP